MFSRDSDKTTKVTSSSSVIGVEMQINGNIKCSGNLVLKGKVKGNIECDHISISSGGFFKGNIKSLNTTIGGDFEGMFLLIPLQLNQLLKLKEIYIIII